MSSPLRIFVGVFGGASRAYHNTVLLEQNNGGSGSGRGWGIQSGLVLAYPLGYSSWLVPRLSYSSLPGECIQKIHIKKLLIPGSNEIVTVDTTLRSSITYRMISADVLYQNEVARIGKARVSLLAGPSVGYVLTGSVYETEEITSGNESHALRVLFDNEIPNRSDFRFSLKGGMQIEIGVLGNEWVLTPGVYFDYGITTVIPSEQWRVNSLSFSIGVSRQFN